MKDLLTSLLDNRTWSVLSQNVSLDSPPQLDPLNLWQEWWHPSISVFGTLSVFLVMKVRVRGTPSAWHAAEIPLRPSAGHGSRAPPRGSPLLCPSTFCFTR